MVTPTNSSCKLLEWIVAIVAMQHQCIPTCNPISHLHWLRLLFVLQMIKHPLDSFTRHYNSQGKQVQKLIVVLQQAMHSPSKSHLLAYLHCNIDAAPLLLLCVLLPKNKLGQIVIANNNQPEIIDWRNLHSKVPISFFIWLVDCRPTIAHLPTSVGVLSCSALQCLHLEPCWHWPYLQVDQKAATKAPSFANLCIAGWIAPNVMLSLFYEW